MSAELFSRLLLGDSNPYAENENWLETILNKELDHILADRPSLPVSGCLLADIGSFLVQAIATLSRLSSGIVAGEHVDIFVKSRIEEMEAQDGFSNLTPMDYMHDKHNSLKAIASRLQKVAEDVDTRWKLSPTPPVDRYNVSRNDRRRWPTAAEPSGPASWPASQENYGGSVAQLSEARDEMPSPVSDQGMQDTINGIIDSLPTRGKGQNYCPYGNACMKGGVSENGELVVFERNSKFKAHLQKHGRSYICELQGCTNKKGFARLDQLQRHQRDVTHR